MGQVHHLFLFVYRKIFVGIIESLLHPYVSLYYGLKIDWSIRVTSSNFDTSAFSLLFQQTMQFKAPADQTICRYLIYFYFEGILPSLEVSRGSAGFLMCYNMILTFLRLAHFASPEVSRGPAGYLKI